MAIREFVLLGGTGPAFLFIRSVVALPFLVVLTYGLKLDRLRPMVELTDDVRVNLILLAACFFGSVRQLLMPFVLRNAEASSIGIISPSIPLFTALIAHFFRLERLTKTTVLCLVLSGLGVFIGLDVSNKFDGTRRSRADSTKLTLDLLLLIPVAKALRVGRADPQVVFLKMSTADFDAPTLLRNQLAFSILFFIPVSFLISFLQNGDLKSALLPLFTISCRRRSPAVKQFLCALYSLLGRLLIGWWIQIYALKVRAPDSQVLGANAVALYQTLRPLFTMIFAAVFLDEHFTVKKTVGSLVVCLALYIYQTNRVRPGEES